MYWNWTFHEKMTISWNGNGYFTLHEIQIFKPYTTEKIESIISEMNDAKLT